MEYRFVDWVTEMLLYEIRDTGNADGLGDLYDAIPRIDRAELGATISLADDETEDVPDQVTFDVVAYDKMGNPLVLVTLNDSREPATQELLGELEEAASAVKANYPDLAAAIAVTSSYFEPGALEVAEQATSGLPQPGLETELRQPLTEERLPPLSGRVPFRRVPHERPRSCRSSPSNPVGFCRR